MPEKETPNNDDLMKEFSEFLEAKRASEQEAKDSEDFDIEIWGPDGSGVRTKRSHAKPFLNKLGIDLDESPSDESVEDDKDGTKKRTRKPAAKAPESSVRKYFTNPKK